MKKTYRMFALVALLAVGASLGLTACQKSDAPADKEIDKASAATNAAPATKSEHPEHPK